MSLYVRLTEGGEDEYGAYPGCRICGSPGELIDNDVRCPEHGWRDTDLFNPYAVTQDDQSLVVLRMGQDSRIGYYTPGSWISYRSD